MKALFLDCFAGISGDMFLGGLCDLGLDQEAWRAGLDALAVSGWSLGLSRVKRVGILATKVDVRVEERQPHRHLADIRAILSQSRLPDSVRERSLAVFTALAEAEGKIHGTDPERVHFHEVGAVDAIVDIVGAALGLHLLGIEAIFVSPLHVGTGFVRCAHGLMPVPAPATAELLCGFPTYATGIEAELVTPTGAALVKSLAHYAGPRPPFTASRIGYGAGAKELAIPNVVRMLLGERAEPGLAPHPGEAVGLESLGRVEKLFMIETNLDDMNPEWGGYVMERLLELGARDVFFTPAQMKKSRSGLLLSVLGDAERLATITRCILQETTAIGLRFYEVDRLALDRRVRRVPTPWGEVAVKEASLGGAVVNRAPEYEACRRVAKEHGVPLKEVYRAAQEAAAACHEGNPA